LRVHHSEVNAQALVGHALNGCATNVLVVDVLGDVGQ